jgi:CheY-like chemotaxis protein
MSTTPRSVLVVDDDANLRQVMEYVLSDAGYRVRTATNGRTALAEVARELPGVILLDMRMPVMDGWEFARLFREQYDHVAPIVVVTAAEEAARRAADIGADAHLNKPFDIDALLALVARFL